MTRWLQGWCAMCLQNDCGMLVRVRNGIVMETRGNPGCPTNTGKLCVRGGLAAIPGYYSPHRIKSPLKRTNPKKGLDEDPRWVQIGWDEPLNLIAARLRKIRFGRRGRSCRTCLTLKGIGVAACQLPEEVKSKYLFS